MHTNYQKRRWPIIVGGVHRSGTSLVRRILNAHSRIYCGPEIKFFKDWSADYIDDPINHARFLRSARTMLPEEELLKILGRAFIEIHERAAQLSRKPRWADKNPENVLYLAEWEKLLGREWLFIQVVRNPLDTLASFHEVNFKYTIPSTLQARIEFYNRYSEAGLTYFQKYPERSYRVVYERLVNSPDQEIERLMQWLGEKMEARQLAFNSIEHQTGLEDPKIANTRNVHKESVDRWKNAFTFEEVKEIINQTVSLWDRLDTRQYYPLQRALESR